MANKNSVNIIDYVSKETLDYTVEKLSKVSTGSNLNFPLTIKQGGTSATDAEKAWENLGGGNVGKLSLPNTVEGKYLADDGTWKEIQVPSVDEKQLQEMQEQITSAEQLATEVKQKAEEIDTNVNHLNDDITEVQQNIISINETLETKLDVSDFTKEKLIELIGIFQGATATQDGEPGLVPAPTVLIE